ncbi:MAG: hypothetical protein J2P50_17750 [Hyphomicrobiaceae bacterium]|nr:hypothetical protein [Hyphomicrobiaceae bacterium]
MSIRLCAIALGAVAPVLFGVQALLAQDDPRKRTDIDKDLAEQLYREQEARRGCKVSICEAARTKTAQGDNIACKVVKTWPEIDLKTKVLKGAMEWPFGNAQCEAAITVDRKLLVAAVSEAKYEAKIGKHDVSCQLYTKDGKGKHALTFTIEPVVTFENGKAVKAALHWSNVGGTTIAKSAAWSATAVDNTFNVLQGAVVDSINEFFGPGCDQALKK